MTKTKPTKNKIALFDLDGTMADYDEAMNRDIEKIMAPGETLPENLHTAGGHWEARTKMIRSQPGWWKNLRVIDRGYWILAKALQMGFECHVLTKGPSSTASAWTEKVEWCRANLPREVKVTITEDKGLVYGAVLVDDYPKYIESWLANRPRGIVIMPDQPINQGFEHPQVLRFHKAALQRQYKKAMLKKVILPDEVNCSEVKRWLRAAYDRPDGKPIKHLYPKGVKIKGRGTLCEEEECKFSGECANHETAGDFRMEGGFTPELTIIKGQLHCATKTRKKSIKTEHSLDDVPVNVGELDQGYLSIKDGKYSVHDAYKGDFEEDGQEGDDE